MDTTLIGMIGVNTDIAHWLWYVGKRTVIADCILWAGKLWADTICVLICVCVICCVDKINYKLNNLTKTNLML